MGHSRERTFNPNTATATAALKEEGGRQEEADEEEKEELDRLLILKQNKNF